MPLQLQPWLMHCWATQLRSETPTPQHPFISCHLQSCVSFNTATSSCCVPVQIFRLLLPHFRSTLAINAAPRSLLIAAGGAIEGISATVGPYSMPLSSKLYGLTWQFKNEGIAADLTKRWDKQRQLLHRPLESL